VIRSLLSQREVEVARLVAEGLSDEEVAQILVISTRTVQSYLDRIGRKLGAEKQPHRRRRVIRVWVKENDRVIAAVDADTTAA
jgi:DNA-binding NarL/FixJ family response regulator